MKNNLKSKLTKNKTSLKKKNKIDNTNKVKINTESDLYNLPLNIIQNTKIYNFYGNYFDKIYNKAIEIEKKGIISTPSLPPIKKLEKKIIINIKRNLIIKVGNPFNLKKKFLQKPNNRYSQTESGLNLNSDSIIFNNVTYNRKVYTKKHIINKSANISISNSLNKKSKKNLKKNIINKKIIKKKVIEKKNIVGNKNIINKGINLKKSAVDINDIKTKKKHIIKNNVIKKLNFDKCINHNELFSDLSASAVITNFPVLREFKIKLIKFEIKFDTKLGESLAVIGSLNELGLWKDNRALKMEWNPGNVWKSCIYLNNYNNIIDFEYKFIILENGHIKFWEDGNNRKFIVSLITGLIEPHINNNINDNELNTIYISNVMNQSFIFDVNDCCLSIISNWNEK